MYIYIYFFFLPVRDKIGPFAKPDYMQEATSLPKTCTDKILRRILYRFAARDRISAMLRRWPTNR